MAGVTQHSAEMHTHPDVIEMRERYERVLGGGSAMTIDGLVLLAGLFLALSPWIISDIGTGTPDVTVHNLVLGIAVGIVGLALAVAPNRAYAMSWVLVPIGAWLIVSPWLVGPTGDPSNEILWTNIIMGIVIAVLGLVGAGILMAGLRARSQADRALHRSLSEREHERGGRGRRPERFEREPYEGERYEREPYERERMEREPYERERYEREPYERGERYERGVRYEREEDMMERGGRRERPRR